MITISKTCLDFIKGYERLVLTPYHGAADPANIFTIGYGTIKYPPYYMGGKAVSLQDPKITEKMADTFLSFEVNYKCKYIDPYLRDDLSENQFAALVSFAYNVGEGGLRSSTLLRRVNANMKDTSIRDEFMKWVHGEGGAVVPGLVNRRRAEADLYFTI